MQARAGFVIAVTVLALTVSFHAAGQTDNRPPASAPLKGTVQVAAAGEPATLDGTVWVRSTLAVAPDGTTTMSYVCGVAGSAMGQTSGTRFAMSGAGSGDVPVTQALPTDVGITCSVTVAAGNVAQQFRLTLQGQLHADGTIASLIVRTIGSL